MEYLFSLSKSATSLALDCSELLLLISGVVLVVGLVGEYRIPETSEWCKRCAAVVIIGVLGELIADGAIFVLSSHLQAINDIEVAELNNEAGEARKTAAETAERQKNSDILIANANKRAAEATQ